MLIVSIDYDDTYTSCPKSWQKVVDTLKDGGFMVFCVTARGPDEPIEHDIGVEVIYCSGEEKALAASKQGVGVDIWIDDMPWIIGKHV